MTSTKLFSELYSPNRVALCLKSKSSLVRCEFFFKFPRWFLKFATIGAKYRWTFWNLVTRGGRWYLKESYIQLETSIFYSVAGGVDFYLNLKSLWKHSVVWEIKLSNFRFIIERKFQFDPISSNGRFIIGFTVMPMTRWPTRVGEINNNGITFQKNIDRAKLNINQKRELSLLFRFYLTRGWTASTRGLVQPIVIHIWLIFLLSLLSLF